MDGKYSLRNGKTEVIIYRFFLKFSPVRKKSFYVRFKAKFYLVFWNVLFFYLLMWLSHLNFVDSVLWRELFIFLFWSASTKFYLLFCNYVRRYLLKLIWLISTSFFYSFATDLDSLFWLSPNIKPLPTSLLLFFWSFYKINEHYFLFSVVTWADSSFKINKPF